MRRAEVVKTGSASSNSGFWPLFRHIQRNTIEMTSPVEMDYEGPAEQERVKRWTMSFLYRTPELGGTGVDEKDASVVVRDTERALTAEEKRVAAQKSADSAKQREAQVERERKDRALIATYTDLKDFDRVRDRALSALDAEITALAERETTLNKTLAAAPPSAASGRPGDAARNAGPLSVSARSELPALRDMLAAKRRDRADIAAIYKAASENFALARALGCRIVTIQNGGRRRRLSL